MAAKQYGEQPVHRPDRAGVIAPGPVIMTLAVAAGWTLDHLQPLGVLASLGASVRAFVAFALILFGTGLILLAGAVFHRLRTPFLPWKASRTIAATKIYSRTRHPMYQGLILITVGVAVLLGSDWGLIAIAPATLVLHFGVVIREERYLTDKFGMEYRSYMSAVPRYGWPFGW